MNHRWGKIPAIRPRAAIRRQVTLLTWTLATAGLTTSSAPAQDATVPDTAPSFATAEQNSAGQTPPAIVLIADDTPTSQQQAADLMKRLDQVSQRLGQIEKIPVDPIWLLVPGLNSNIPSAYGGGKGTIGIGAGYQERTRYSKKDDGAIGMILGFGDSEKLGADVQLSVLDLSDFADRASVSVKLHRRLKNDYAVAVGLENLLVRGFTDGRRSVYAVVSKKVRLDESSRKPFSRLYLSAGIGNGRFRPEHIVLRDTGSVNVFGSASINLSRSAILFTEWTGQALNVGVSLVPWKNLPLVITPALADVAGPGGDGTRFTLGIGYLLK